MRRRRSAAFGGLFGGLTLVALVPLGPLVASDPITSNVPVPVSPGTTVGLSTTDDRCPTFNWGAVDDADSYELLVYPLPLKQAQDRDQEPVEPKPVLRVSVPGTARGYTPPLTSCFERGRAYAWLLRAKRAASASDWSETSVFEVASAPSLAEIEDALELLRAYRQGQSDRELTASADLRTPTTARAATARSRGHANNKVRRLDRRTLQRSVAAPAGTTKTATAAAAPNPAVSASLSLSGNLRMAAASNVIKDGSLLLWDDADRNTALGRDALSSNTIGTDSTAIGAAALQNSTGNPTYGSKNTAVGASALRANTTGFRNTAVGQGALEHNTAGFRNTAIGQVAMFNNLSGILNTAVGNGAAFSNSIGSFNTGVGQEALSANSLGSSNTAVGFGALKNGTHPYYSTAVGRNALYNATGDNNIAVGSGAGKSIATGGNNIMIGATGSPGDSNTVRIGNSYHTATFLNGIFGQASGSGGVPVVVSSSGKLGTTVSSRRYKDHIRDMGDSSHRILELRPVRFRYKKGVLGEDTEPGAEYGLIAEEVAEIYPELVAYDDRGRPDAVRYQVLIPMLLNELERQQGVIEDQAQAIEELRRSDHRNDRPSRRAYGERSLSKRHPQ